MNGRADWKSNLFNVVAAAIIALLIWAYADDRTRESASVSGTVRLAAADPRDGFVDPSSAVQIAVEVRGSRRAIETVEEALRSGMTLAVGGEGLPSAPGAHSASLREVLSANPTVAATGAEVIRVRPESLRYETGTLVTEQVPVAVGLPNASLRGTPTAEPSVVTVTMPAAAREAAGPLSVEASVDARALQPGRHRLDVELRLPETLSRWREQCRIVPPRGVVSFELASATAELTLDAVPVRLSISPQAAERWEVTPDEGATSIAGVVVSGPAAAIAELSSGRFPPAAVIDLGDAPGRVGAGDYAVSYWRLPDGVSVTRTRGSEPGAQPAVRLRVLPRNPATQP